jgi:hypothetical protein
VVELRNHEEIDLIQKMNGSTRNWEMIDQKNEMMPSNGIEAGSKRI